MTDAYLMDADCIHGETWYECKQCDDPTPDEPVCEGCQNYRYMLYPEYPCPVCRGGEHQ